MKLLMGMIIGFAGFPAPGQDSPSKRVEKQFKAAETVDNDRERLTDELVTVAGDKKRSREDRLNAMNGLGALGTRKAFDFMVEHIELSLVDPLAWRSEPPPLREQCPCFYYLVRNQHGEDRRDWAVMASIFGALDKPRTDDELRHYASALCWTLETKRQQDGSDGKARAAQFIKAEAELAKTEVKAKNLKLLLEKAKGRE